MVQNVSELGGRGGAQELGKLGCGKERRPGHKTVCKGPAHKKASVGREERDPGIPGQGGSPA